MQQIARKKHSKHLQVGLNFITSTKPKHLKSLSLILTDMFSLFSRVNRSENRCFAEKSSFRYWALPIDDYRREIIEENINVIKHSDVDWKNFTRKSNSLLKKRWLMKTVQIIAAGVLGTKLKKLIDSKLCKLL